VAGLDGGMARLVEALVASLVELGTEIRTGCRATGIERAEGGWTVRVAGDEAEVLPADVIVVAVPEAEARRLLVPVVPALDAEPAPAPVVEIVTLVVAEPALDGHPRGNGVLTVPGTSAAKALTHASAKWDWVSRAAGDGVHVVRVSFGAQNEPPATESLSDADAADLALREASTLLGVPLDASRLRGAHRERYVQAQPGSVLGRGAAVAAAQDAIRAVPGLGAVGAWLAGTGLAQVVPHATAEADRVRRAALWGGAGSQV